MNFSFPLKCSPKSITLIGLSQMSVEELEDYVTEQFDELRNLVLLEEKRTLHLVDLKEAFLTASAAEKIAEITAETERLQEELANITDQLTLLEQVDADAGGPALAQVLMATAPSHRVLVRKDYVLLLFYIFYTAFLLDRILTIYMFARVCLGSYYYFQQFILYHLRHASL